MRNEPRYLLIVACSKRKRLDPGLVPAIQRYDGATFRVLRKAQRECYWPKNLDVVILSARYGLIEAPTPIAYYEQRMSAMRAGALHRAVLEDLVSLMKASDYSEVYIDLGQDYLPAIVGSSKLFADTPVRYAEGRIGERMKSLKHWLRSKSEE